MTFSIGKLSPKKIGTLITILSLLTLVLLGVVTHQQYRRIDLTSQRIYTLSSYTRQVLSQLPDPIEITYFITPRLVAEIPEIMIIQDLLQEMEKIQPNLFQLRIVDPESSPGFTPEDLGISPQQYQVIEANQQSLALVYSGIALSFRDRFTSLPLVTDPQFLEYDLIRSIQELLDTRRSRIGILLGDQQLVNSSQVLLSQVQATFETEILAPGDDISPEFSALLVLGHQDLGIEDVFTIDQYILSGGSVFFGIHYHYVDIAQGLLPREGSQTPLLDLLESYGIRVLSEWITDTQNRPIPVQQSQGRVMFTALQDYLLWPRISATRANSHHPVTRGFAGLDGFWMSPLGLVGIPSEIEIIELLRSNLGSGSHSPPLNTDPRMLEVSNIQPDGFPLSYALEGRFSSGFTQPPRGREEQRFLTQGLAPARLIVIGDQFLFSDLIQVNQSFQNLEFLQNALEWLAREDELLAMRSRTLGNTRLDRIQNPQIREFQMNLVQFAGIFIGPGVFGVLGLLRVFRRRKFV